MLSALNIANQLIASWEGREQPGTGIDPELLAPLIESIEAALRDEPAPPAH